MGTITEQTSRVEHLQCSNCGATYSAFEAQTPSACCQLPLEARYDLRLALQKEQLSQRQATMWRYRE
ncbi:MAG: threonine synthase, partial [Pontibacter sp.]|nr:threonine synthase [Pontibacter sp.]